ncbi:MAG: prolyl oligopeptidase family serine peptidase [Planctomycetes bacterium]|nr:prolyl oligopeptidase family serine peptidase [Planctomycetota bacterium]
MKRYLSLTIALALCFSMMTPVDCANKKKRNKNKQPANDKSLVQKVVETESSKFKVVKKYLLSVPKDYSSSSSKKWPLIMCLHGVGGRGDNIRIVAVKGISKIIESGKKNYDDFFVISPQCKKDGWWSRDGGLEELAAIVDDVCENYKIDKSRLIITGQSMGGMGTWSMITRYPEKFCAAAPVCGAGSPKTAKKVKHMPIWFFHGDKDKVVPHTKSLALHEALEKAGSKSAKITIYPGIKHNCWDKTYSREDLVSWMLEQKL